MFASRWGAEEWGLVQDLQREWMLQDFAPGPAIRTRGEHGWWMRSLDPGEAVPEEAELLEAGWDHEHCAMCWAKIGTQEGAQQQGWVSEPHWLCPACHERYVIDRAAERFGDRV